MRDLRQAEAGSMMLTPVRVCLAAIAFFATWTVTVQVLSFGAASARYLWVALVVACAAAIASLRLAPRLREVLDSVPVEMPRLSVARVRECLAHRGRRVFLAGVSLAFVAAFGLLFVTHSFWALWVTLLAAACGGVLLGSQIAAPCRPAVDGESGVSPRSTPRSDTRELLLLILVVVAAYLFTGRADLDDAFYLNLPIGMMSAEHGLLQFDTMHGRSEWPLMMSSYRLESLPALVATLSWISRLPVIYVAHALIPLAFCIVGCCALYIIYRRIFPREWLVGALINVATLFILDGSIGGYASHGLVRLIHGKGMLITFMVPSVVYLTVVAIRAKASMLVVLLAALHIAALGMTANAIYVSPLAMGLTTLAEWLLRPRANLRFSAMVLSSVAYLVLAGLFLIVFDPPIASEATSPGSIHGVLWMFFPSKGVFVGFSALLFVCAVSCGVDRRYRLLSIYVGCFVLLVLNPAVWNYWGRVTGNLNARLFWAVPVPTITAIAIMLVWQLHARFGRLAAAALLALGLLGPSSALAKGSGVQLGWQLKKVKRDAYSAAMQANQRTPRGRRILACEDVAAWVPTMERHRFPVISRPLYLVHYSKTLGAEALAQRALLTEWVCGRQPESDGRALKRALRELEVGTIVTRQSAAGFEAIDAFVRSLGASVLPLPAGYQLYRLR